MKRLIILSAFLFLPLSSAHAFELNYLGSFTNPLKFEIVPSPTQTVRSFTDMMRPFEEQWRLNTFLNTLGSIYANPSNILRLNGGSVPLDSYYTRAKPQQQESQQRANNANQAANVSLVQIFQNTRHAPVHIAPTPAPQNPAPTNPQPDTAAIQSIIDQMSATITPADSNCDTNGNCWGSAAGGSL